MNNILTTTQTSTCDKLLIAGQALMAAGVLVSSLGLILKYKGQVVLPLNLMTNQIDTFQ